MFSKGLSEKQIGSDTLLHKLLRNANSVGEIKKFIETQDKKSLVNMANTVNDRGELPIFMINALPFSQQEYLELQSLLIPFTIPSPSKYASFKQFNKKEILKRYAFLKGSPLYANIELGVKAVKVFNQ